MILDSLWTRIEFEARYFFMHTLRDLRYQYENECRDIRKCMNEKRKKIDIKACAGLLVRFIVLSIYQIFRFLRETLSFLIHGKSIAKKFVVLGVWALIIAGFVYKPAVSWTIIGILGGIQVMVAFESALENYLNKISGNVVYLEFWLEIYWGMENFLEMNKEES